MSLRREELEEAEVREVLVRRGEQEFGPAAPTVTRTRPPRLLRGVVAAAVAALIALALVGRSRVGATALAGSVAKADTVPVGSVPYGPDISPGSVVDPSFRPSAPLPTGLALAANVGFTLWGCGDRKVGGAQPPDGAAAVRVERVLGELVRHVRERANPRDSFPLAYPLEAALRVDDPAIVVQISLEWRNGSSGQTISVPLGRGSKADADLARVVHVAAKRLTDSVGDSIQWMRGNDPNLP